MLSLNDDSLGHGFCAESQELVPRGMDVQVKGPRRWVLTFTPSSSDGKTEAGSHGSGYVVLRG